MWTGATARRVFLISLVVVACLPVWVVDVTANAARVGPRTWIHEEVAVVVGYVHSVERTWVEERYAVDRGGLRLTRMKWQSSGAGLPGEYDRFEDGFYVKELESDIGRVLDYWFLPLNRAEISIDGAVVFRGPDAPSRVVVRVYRAPLAVAAFDAVRART